MIQTNRPILFFSFFFLFILGGKLISQPVINPQNFPEGIDPSQIPQSQLPQLQERLKQLRDAGVSESEIRKRLQMPQSGIPGITQPASSDPNPNPSQNNNDPANLNPNVQLEGTESVIDEEDTEFKDKPKNQNPAYLGPPILSNVFGHKIFADSAGRFIQDVNPRPNPDYIIGEGDVFTVTIWGCSELSESLVVREDGSIWRSYMGKVYIGGLTYTKAQEILLARYKGLVSSCSQIEVFMGKSRRTIHVNIVGEVFSPGSYQINAAVPAFNALFKARGITDIGSVRNILIKRGGRTVQTLDIYDYLIKGKNEPVYLQDNDFIYVPVQDKIAEVEGAVKRPMEYELKEGENLKALLEFAGGLNYDAMRSDAQIARLQSEREVLINFHLDSILTNSNKDFRIQEGDKLIIKTLNKGAFNIVQAFGNLEYPGTYQLLPGERISNLIARAGGLGIDAYKDRAYVVRIVPGSNEVIYIPVNLNEVYDHDNPIHNLELQYFDALIIFAESDFHDERYINISGMVRTPGVVKLSPTMTLKDLLFLAGGPREDADLQNIELSVITRADHLARKFQNPEESEIVSGESENSTEEGEKSSNTSIDINPEDLIVRRISIDEDWRNDPAIDTLLIYEFDRVQVYSKYDFKNFEFIEVGGAVKNPGKFPMKKGMTIKDLLYLSGGLNAEADVNEVELYQDIDYEEMGHYGVSTDRPEIVRIRIEKDWQEGTVTDTFQVEGFKRMIVRSENEFFDQGYVMVKGLVNRPGQYEVRPNMTLLDVFYQAGGPKLSADFDRVELSRVIEVMDGEGKLIPVPVDIKTVSINQNWQEDSILASMKINSFDQVFVRKN
ncbi:MAG: SLBB domain-containing protein, partial [Bacteroidetes bacterium]|nr:SLBB domain-containing protein [Bacteroidota bacterium]